MRLYNTLTKRKEEFVQIISPYIRKNSPSPDGEKLAKGIGIASELHHGDPRLNSIIDQYPSHMKQAANGFFLSSVSLLANIDALSRLILLGILPPHLYEM